MKTRSLSAVDEVRQELLAGAGGLAERARRVVRWRAAAIWLTCLLATLGLLLVVDANLRREEMGLRLLAVLTLIGSSIATAYRFLKPAWSFCPTPLEVAKWIEQQQPGLGERLSTVLQLASISSDEKRFGSHAFRETALQEWSRVGFQPAWDSYLNTKPWWRSLGLLLSVLLALACAFVAWPDASRLAAKRLAMPWSANHWPRQDRLRLLDPPTAVALGSELQLEAIDLNLPLPIEVNFQMRLAEAGRDEFIVIASTIVGEIAVANVPIVEHNIEVRAVGGDDDSMPWHRIDVVKPPQLENYRFEVFPPDYTGQAAVEIVGRRIQVLAGSRLRCTGQLSEPVQDLTLNSVATSQEAVNSVSEFVPKAKWATELDGDARTFVIGGQDGWEITESLTWQLIVTTDAGLRVALPDRWEIEVVEDAPPTVLFQEPLLLEVASVAQLPIFGRAHDDQGLVKIAVRTQIAAASSSMRNSLQEQPVPLSDVRDSELVLWEWNAEVEPISTLCDWPIDANLDLSREASLDVGQQVTVWIEARDTLGQLGKSQSFVLKIRAAEDLIDAIQNRQQQVYERLRAIVDTQRRNMQLAIRTAGMVTPPGRVQQETVDALTSVSQIQSSIGAQMVEGPASVLAEVEAMRALLSQNRLSDSELAEELDALGQKMREIAASTLPKAISEAYAARELASKSLSSNATSELKSTLQQSSETQATLLDELQTLLDRLARNEAMQQVQRELIQILNQQLQLKSDTDSLHLQDVSGIDHQELATKTAGLNADQLSLARQLDNLTARARELGEAEDELVAAAQTPMHRMADALVETQASSLMRRGAEAIASGQMSTATGIQEQARAALQKALSVLGLNSSATNSLAGRAEQLRQASQQLSELAEQQSELAKEMLVEPSANDLANWGRTQANLQQTAENQAEQLQASGNARSARGVESAVQSQQAAQQALEQHESEAATSQAQRAAEKLKDVAQELQQRAEHLENEVRLEQLSQMAPSLLRLLAEQAPIVEHLKTLSEGLRDQQLELDPEEVRGIAAQQESVRQDLRDMRDSINKLPAFDWALEQTDVDMSRAVAAAQRMRVDPEALDAAVAAMTKLRLATAALEPPQPPSETPTADETNEAGDQDSNDQPLPPVASLKLLRGLQQDINDRTRLWESSNANQVRREKVLDVLADEQQALGKQLEQLLRELAASNDSNQ